MKWIPQSNDCQSEYLVSDKYESDGILLTSGRVLIKDALIQDGYVFLNGRKSINYEKRNVLVKYLDILETTVKYKMTINTFLNILIRVLPVVILALCLLYIMFLVGVDKQLTGKQSAIHVISLSLLFIYVPYYFVLCIFKDGKFKRFYDATLCLIVNACDNDPQYVIEKKLSALYANEISMDLNAYINHCWRIRNGIPDKECIKLFSNYVAESPVISELGMPLGRSTSISGLVERPSGVLDF